MQSYEQFIEIEGIRGSSRKELKIIISKGKQIMIPITTLGNE